ncbi:MAG: hypothetical protein ACLPXB_16165 [Thiobacillaceae bacterium]
MNSGNEKAAHQLQDVRQWAKDKLTAGAEPPWSWYQYMKLVETIDAILSGSSCASTKENSPQSEQHQDAPLRLVDSTYLQDSAQRHPVGLPVPLPM